MLAFIKPLLISCLLIFRGPKWVTCSSQESVWEGLCEGLHNRTYNSSGIVATTFYCRLPSVHIDFSPPPTLKIHWTSLRTPKSCPIMASRSMFIILKFASGSDMVMHLWSTPFDPETCEKGLLDTTLNLIEFLQSFTTSFFTLSLFWGHFLIWGFWGVVERLKRYGTVFIFFSYH